MTIYRSGAVTAGIMPDYSQAGVMLCRTGTYLTTDDQILSGDTIQMVPVPKYACIMDIHVYADTQIQGASHIEIGDGASPARFMNTLSFGDVNYADMMTDGVALQIGYCYDEGNDTIDITLGPSCSTNIPTSITFTMHVFYKMQGSISDESWTGLATT